MALLETKTQRKKEHENGLADKSRAQQTDLLEPHEPVLADTITAFPLQPQLEVGEPDDELEKEADSTADAVMLMPDVGLEPSVQLMPSNDKSQVALMPERNFNAVQLMPAARLSLMEEEADHEEEVDSAPEVQRQMDAANEDDEVQRQPDVQRSENGGGQVSPGLESNIKSSKGSGSKLPSHVAGDLGGKIGADFSKVNIHTDSNAVQMNKEIGAKAFTHGSDIYFNQGNYNPASNEGKHLLSHELTHTIQQGATSKVQAKEEEQAKDQDTSGVALGGEAKKDPSAAGPDAETKKDTAEEAPGTNGVEKEEKKAEPEPKPKEQAESSAAAPDAQAKVNGAAPVVAAEPEKKAEDESELKIEEDASVVAPDVMAASGEEGVEGGGGAPAAGGGGGRMIDIAKPEFDGLAEQAMADMAASRGAAKAELRQGSAKKLSQKKSAIQELAKNEKEKKSAAEKLAETQAAIQETPGDKEQEMNTAQVASMEQTEKPEVAESEAKQEKDKAIDKLVRNVTSLEDLDNIKSTAPDMTASVMKNIHEQTAGVTATYEQLDTAQQKPEAVVQAETLPEPELPVETPALDLGTDLIPKVKDDQLAFLEQSSQEADNLYAKEGLDAPGMKEVVDSVDSGDIGEANANKAELQEKAASAPAEIRKAESDAHSNLEKDLKEEENKGRQDMRKERDKELKDAGKKQGETKSAIEIKRKAVTDHIKGIYETANQSVSDKLAKLETDSMKAFDEANAKASKELEDNIKSRMEVFKDERYGGLFGWARWLKDLIWDITELPVPKRIFQEERENFIVKIDRAIAKITADNKAVIEECHKIIAATRTEIDEYVATLGDDVKDAAVKAQEDIQKKLDSLDAKVNEKEQELQAKLEMKREEAIKAIDEKLEKMKEEMGPALAKLGNLLLDALMKVFEWALTAAGKSPDEIMGIINKARSTITAIVSDPLGFFANLGKAVGQGFQNFTNNVGEHLQNALVGWLTGAVGGAFKIPEKFDVKGVFTMATSVLGIGWDFIRSVLVKIVGEKIMSAAETGFGLITKVLTEGPMALWDEIKDQLSGLKDMVVDAIKNWAIVQIVKKASIKLLSMLNPAGAIVQAILLIYDTVMFFIENWDRIVDFVNSIFSSIGDIAAGKVASAAKYIEKVLGLGLTILMSFLARFVGLGGIAKKIIGILNKLRKKVQKAIRKAAKKIGKKIKKWFKGKKGGKDKKGKTDKDKKDLKKKGLLDWWDNEAKFTTPDKGKHRLFYKGSGEKAKLYLASDEDALLVHLDKAAKETKEGDKTNLENIDAAKKQYTGKVQPAEKTLKKLQSKQKSLKKKASIDANDKAIKDADKRHDTAFNELKNLLDNINFSGEGKPVTEKTNVIHSPSTGRPLKVEANPLTWKSGNTQGSVPGSANPPGWEHANSGDRKGLYVRGHLLNHNLHGPNDNWNLVPITNTSNSQMRSKVEDPAKSAVNTMTVILKYVTEITKYHESDTDNQVKFYPAEWSVAWYYLTKDGKKDSEADPNGKAIKGGGATFRQGTPPSPYNLNDLGTELLVSKLGLDKEFAASVTKVKNEMAGGHFASFPLFEILMNKFYVNKSEEKKKINSKNVSILANKINTEVIIE